MEIILDMRPLGDAEAEGAEDLHDLVDGLGNGMDAAGGLAADRQRDVDPLRHQPPVQLGRGEPR